MKKILMFFVIICFCHPLIFTQNFDSDRHAKKSKKDWAYAIDTTWGQGLSTAEKLNVFNTWWNRIDQSWGGFPNADLNWGSLDSLHTYYSNIINSGVSSGRFQGMLNRLSRSLNEAHTSITNRDIDTIMGIYYWEFPYHPSFRYKPGIPLLNISGIFFRNSFGAGITAFMDSIAFVYSVIPNHPLNLQPGDIILGYDGLPWKENLQELFDQELPLLYGGFLSGSNNKSSLHINTSAVGMNWGLFDTIDILKYSTGDTIHFPTTLLNNIPYPYPLIPVKGQLPINGVPYVYDKSVSWGVVDGTNIGYIYVYDWAEASNTAALFVKAVDTLIHCLDVTGLIIDSRFNGGGQQAVANGGFKHLFNEDPTSKFCDYVRVPGGAHFDFQHVNGMISAAPFVPTSELFDHPIAVLTGPECLSWGDMNAFRLRFHPMTRLFGKETNGAFVTFDNWGNVPFLMYNIYNGLVYNGSVYSNYNNEGYLIHKGNPVDEEVWLTPDGVANGEDDVVIRALEWIDNLVYPHDILCDTTYYTPGAGSVSMSSIIENPNTHQLSARGYIHNLNNVLIDSSDLSIQESNKEGETWVGNIPVPPNEDFFKITITVSDLTASSSFMLPNAKRFTTSGPVVLDSIRYLETAYASYCQPFITNLGDSTLHNVTGKLISYDPWVTNINPPNWNIQTLPPGISTGSTSLMVLTVIDSLYPIPGELKINFEVQLGHHNWSYWYGDYIVGVEGEDEKQLQFSYSLEQNYPNPFNPGTNIKYSIPELSKVKLTIYNLLGEEIKVLIDEEKTAGVYSVNFNSANLPSGVYFYQLKAGEYVNTRKMILIK